MIVNCNKSYATCFGCIRDYRQVTWLLHFCLGMTWYVFSLPLSHRPTQQTGMGLVGICTAPPPPAAHILTPLLGVVGPGDARRLQPDDTEQDSGTPQVERDAWVLQMKKKKRRLNCRVAWDKSTHFLMARGEKSISIWPAPFGNWISFQVRKNKRLKPFHPALGGLCVFSRYVNGNV